jgi:alkaline phosphatase
LIHLVSIVLLLGLIIGLVSTAQAEPKYVIFLIGDGMGFEHVKAAGMYANGQAGTLSFETFPYKGRLTNYAANSPVPDSAASGTALATGTKVNIGVVSMAYPGDGSELETLLEYFKARGKSTGLVTTTLWFDATPACFGAHEPSRGNYAGIAYDYWLQTRPNVVFGGYHDEGVAAMSESVGYTVVTSRAAMQALDTETETMVFGQFGSDNLPYEYDGLGSLPHLSEMTTTALSILDNDPDGFFLMAEGGLIDHASHFNDIQRAILETVEFDNTVQVAIDWAAGRSDTLILVTADHETGGLTVLANNGAGVLPTVNWSSAGHTETNVPVYAWGENAEIISGVMDNTEIFGVVTAGPEAWHPNPADGAVHPDTRATLSWRMGAGAVWHDVYFGENFDDVNGGTGGAFRGRQTETSFTVGSPESAYPQELVRGVTYYWRVDEVNELDPNSPYKGDVWSFTVPAETAYNPDPPDGALCEQTWVNLRWRPGKDAVSHNVYFGDNFDDVNDGTGGTFRSNQTETVFTVGLPGFLYPDGLVPGMTYYWRIDEVLGTGRAAKTLKGDVWSFTLVPKTAQSLRLVTCEW